MRKPFTIIAALLVLIVAAAHLYRAYADIPIGVGDQMLPVMWSWILGGVFAVIGVMTFLELKK